jgi:fucokinase
VIDSGARASPEFWHYLILTAGNDDQAASYEAQIRVRRDAGRLAQVRDTLVVADFEGRRVGSGGSTLQCLREVLRREAVGDFADAGRVLRGLRILIVHAGGDSRRLPAYSPRGKVFVPLPGDSPSALFDRLVPSFLDLPGGSRLRTNSGRIR